MRYHESMITTVTTKNMVSIPAAIAREHGIRPGYKLDWSSVAGSDDLRVQVIPDRAALAERLFGIGRDVAPGRDLVSELDDAREAEDAGD
jgi:bifunctional DNA-binding transcriptional regulator/antitoxin component of YhaV-PrlF toxin-antitoxin module